MTPTSMIMYASRTGTKRNLDRRAVRSQKRAPSATSIAALYVARNGHYFGLPGVDPWDEERDARNYPGPYPVVAHPPCARWCRLAGLVEAKYGLKRGDDGGCFEAALDGVRRYGGVLEHPHGSCAWREYGLLLPLRGGGWTSAGDGVGWTCCVEQGNYGHRARKATWLYAAHVALPSLVWGPSDATAWVSYCGNHNSGKCVERLSKKQRNATPPLFRDALIAIARSAYNRKNW